MCRPSGFAGPQPKQIGARPVPLLQAELVRARDVIRAIVGGVNAVRVRIGRNEFKTLPDNVRQLVEEIEHEIGEDGFEISAPGIAGDGHGASAAGSVEGDAAVEAAVRQILLEMGEDPDREGLRRYAHRVCAACIAS